MELRIGQAVKHVSRTLHEAKFAGYTKTGRVKVTHNFIYPHGVALTTDSFKSENIIPADSRPKAIESTAIHKP